MCDAFDDGCAIINKKCALVIKSDGFLLDLIYKRTLPVDALHFFVYFIFKQRHFPQFELLLFVWFVCLKCSDLFALLATIS